MTRRERLMATLRGQPVDRPPVSFYEIDNWSFLEDPPCDDPFNILTHPSWKPLLDLARKKADRIFRMGIALRNEPPDPLAELTKSETFDDENGSRHTVRTIRAGGRTLT